MSCILHNYFNIKQGINIKENSIFILLCHIYEYNDIDPNFKETHKMTKSDTGIDLCNLTDTIVQCKLRKDTLSWQEMGTFFASNMIREEGQLKVKWQNQVVARNDCTLSKHLKTKQDLFVDKTYDIKEMLTYCEDLLINPPVHIDKPKEIGLRDYQLECIDLINTSQNVVICLPTGTGKNIIMIHSFQKGLKYLVLVPKIVLMEQFYEEILNIDCDTSTKERKII